MKSTNGKTVPNGGTRSSNDQRRGILSRDRGIGKAKATKPTRKHRALPSRERKYGEILDQHYQLINKLDNEILSAVYCDINLTSLAKARNEPRDRQFYGVHYMWASNHLDIALSHENYWHLLGDTPPHPDQDQTNRLHKFVEKHGWNILAICAFSKTFRHSVATSSVPVWERLENNIAKNIASLELFAEMRGLGAENLLLEKGIQDMPRPVGERRSLIRDHPHHWVLKADKTLEPPMYEGHLQEHIDKNIFNPSDWKAHGIKKDPTLRKPTDGPCVICNSPTLCDCVIQSHPYTSVVELCEYKGKGTGVRAIKPIEKRSIIGQFVGEIKPLNGQGDFTYSLVHESSGNDKVKALISPKRYGNWTRFINHSCDPSTSFMRVTVGRYTAMVVYAERDIAPFEEITVDYGAGYLESLDCRCGTARCRRRQGQGQLVRVF